MGIRAGLLVHWDFGSLRPCQGADTLRGASQKTNGECAGDPGHRSNDHECRSRQASIDDTEHAGLDVPSSSTAAVNRKASVMKKMVVVLLVPAIPHFSSR